MISSLLIIRNINKVATNGFMRSRMMFKEHHFQRTCFRDFSSSIDKVDNIFISINHSEKIKEDDNDTKKILTPLQHKDNHEQDHHYHNDHDHSDSKDNRLDDEMEQEDMFVAPDVSLGHNKIEWGGPRRGGRYKEPTRFGDWERKGRCTDF